MNGRTCIPTSQWPKKRVGGTSIQSETRIMRYVRFFCYTENSLKPEFCTLRTKEYKKSGQTLDLVSTTNYYTTFLMFYLPLPQRLTITLHFGESTEPDEWVLTMYPIFICRYKKFCDIKPLTNKDIGSKTRFNIWVNNYKTKLNKRPK